VLQLDVELHYVNSFDTTKQLNVNSSLSNVPLITIEPYYPGLVLSLSLDLVRKNCLKPYLIGVKNEFSTKYGTYLDHLEHHKLDSSSISKTIRELI
jgi:hypothetical protein